tara:strand:- start:359 stop:1093 length:735 start_codon:yes stop_codon:yes gene_type:complete
MLVSIIIPYYKSERFIRKTIASIINQSYKNWEAIIIDDENSKISLRAISFLKDRRIKILKNINNKGVAKTRNIGISKAKGSLVAFLDSDDYWHKDKLKFQISLMRKNNYNISYTSYTAFEKNKDVKYFVKAKSRLKFSSLIKSNPICCSSVVVKKKFLSKNPFPNLKTKEDYALWLKISKKYDFYPIDKNLTFHRIRKDSLSSFHFNKLINAFTIYNNFLRLNIVYSFYCVVRLYINAFIKKYL